MEQNTEQQEPFTLKYPTQPTKRQVIRAELMMELDKWDNNDEAIAKRTAMSLIIVLQEQFKIEIQKL